MQAFSIEKWRVVVEPTEDMEEISLDDNIPSRITRVSMQANPSIHKELILFLKNNHDVFAWSHEDMLGINPTIMGHKLNVCMFFPPVRQKKSLRLGKSQSHS